MGKWIGLYSLIEIDGEIYEVELFNRSIKFRFTSIWPFYIESEEIKENNGSTNNNDSNTIVIDILQMEVLQP